MNTVISPHTDDAIFSIGKKIISMDDVTIACPLAGVPDEPFGNQKHTILNQEHEQACKLVGAKIDNGPYFDDVYGPQNLIHIADWLSDRLKSASNVYIPLGIKHPDHVMISNICIDLIKARDYKTEVFFYEELPYAHDYRSELQDRLRLIKKIFPDLSVTYESMMKLAAVKAYASQVDGNVIDRIFTGEEVILEV